MFGLVSLLSLLSACNLFIPNSEPDVISNHEGSQLDVTLGILYDHLGGEKVLGPVISELAIDNGRKFQYTMNGLLVYDESRPTTEYYSLAPLGVRIGISEPPVPPPDQPGLIYTNGHIVDPDFASFFDENMSVFVGLPLTEVLYNSSRGRYEQYFENLGFYKNKGTGEVGLLAYGTFDCQDKCDDVDAGLGVIDYKYKEAPVFRPLINKYGWRFTGFPLGELFEKDGKLHQVFQNMVLTAGAADQPESVRLLNITGSLDIHAEEPRLQSGAPDMNFFGTSGELGYEIPLYFWDYLMAHGGLEVSGAPITHLESTPNQTIRQCFENLCLVFDPNAPLSLRIAPETLGAYYLGKHGEAPVPAASQSEKKRSPLILRINESQPTLPMNQQQNIEISVSRDGFPVPGIVLEIVLDLPDGSSETYVLPASGSDGKTAQLLPVIQADNGTVILYQVCVIGQDETNICYEDSFTIWSQP